MDQLNIQVLTKILPTKGNLVYEYNPFRNYRLTQNMYEYEGELYSKDQLETKFGITWQENKQNPEKTGWYEGEQGEKLDDNFSPICREKGELVDFITDLLSFDLNHPVHIIPQYSYDGSVNLIFNDGKNLPRLINSRFSATGKNTYEIVDRKGNSDTNIYDLGEQFDIDTSLYKRVSRIPKLTLESVASGGALKCGNYHFYFKLADADDNETDFVAESGLVSVFIGEKIPSSIYTGNRDENSVKQVLFRLSNIDPSYNYVYVYYSRATAEDGENRVITYKKIDRKFLVNNFKEANILINGSDNEIDVTAADINLSYNVVDSANCSTTAQSMLFLGNIHKPDIPYAELTDLSLRMLPYLKDERYDLDMDLDYNITSLSKGYYDPKFIYDKVGYWDKEIYRLGVVYILSNGELSPVFNIRGRENILVYDSSKNQYRNYKLREDAFPNNRIYIKSNESSNLILNPNETEKVESEITDSWGNFENTKGVLSLDSLNDSNTIHSIEIRMPIEVQKELINLGIRGYFFVRQTRIPLILTLGITLGLDKEGRLPTIPTKGGILTEIAPKLDESTYVETKDINTVNFVSEGFLSRYHFDLKRSKSSIWAKIGKIAGICAAAVAVVAASVVTCGAAGIITGSLMTTVLAAGTAGMAIGVATGAAAGAVAGAVVATTAASIDEIRLAINRGILGKELKGRNTEIPDGFERKELDDSRLLGKSFEDRIIIKDYTKNDITAVLCPDYDVAPLYYNQLFTGGEFVIKTNKSQAVIHKDINVFENGHILVGYYFKNDGRHFYIPRNAYADSEYANSTYISRIQAVPDNITCVSIDRLKFRSRAGSPEEAWRYECIGDDFKQIPSTYSAEEDVEQSADADKLTDKLIKQENIDKEINSDIVRGAYGPYLGLDYYGGTFGETIQIMIPGYSSSLLRTYFDIRMQDSAPFYAISDRFELTMQKLLLQGDNTSTETIIPLYRGDCYICQFTHRLLRNFNDPSAPYNSTIVDSKSWKSNYKITKSEAFAKINLGDVNAVNLGMWVTFTIRSNRNLNVRSLDGSEVAETVAMGHPKGFFPYHGMIAEGSHKSAEALVYNDGFAKNLGDRFNFEVPDVPHIKNWFGTRIMYSDIHITDGFKNGYRVFQGQNYRDYTRLYGSIVKLLNYSDNIFVVFEHGLAIIPVNERAVAGQGAGGNVYINTSNVLPEHPKIISESYGSLWPDSVIITPQDGTSTTKIFGVDTCAKKIWMFDGSGIQIISDFKVQEFLNNNLTLSEREKTPILGLRNVKTAYNAFKHDVMFTFYDDISSVEERVWNLCYNTVLNKFITFYSWVPSFMENINNIPFSFNRDVSKWIAKLGKSHAENSFAEGITLSSVVYKNAGTPRDPAVISLKNPNTYGGYTIDRLYLKDCPNNLIGLLNLEENILPEGQNIDCEVEFELMRDIYGNYQFFDIRKIEGKWFKDLLDKESLDIKKPIYGLFFKDGIDLSELFTELYYRNSEGHLFNDFDKHKVSKEELKTETNTEYFKEVQDRNLPIFHARDGSIPSLPNPINKNRIILQLNVKANIFVKYEGNKSIPTLAEYMLYLKSNPEANPADAAGGAAVSRISAGSYESSIAVTSEWNLQFLTSDFWKHGQAGAIDIKEDIFPTKWYGDQHPFEFEFIVVNDPGVHKIFQNIEIVSNKAEPESFHFEVIGETYDFAKDKPNIYFRLEARKALLLYNGVDISYNKNFLKISPELLHKSAELVHSYYERLDTLNEIYDRYNLHKNSEVILYTIPSSNEEKFETYNYWAETTSPNKDYSHLSGAEIVYYPNRLEYRVWQHLPAINIDKLDLEKASSVIRGNCQYLEDRWKVSINPLLICYKNEYINGASKMEWSQDYSLWKRAHGSNVKLPPITIGNTVLPMLIVRQGSLTFPGENEGTDNALYNLYNLEDGLPIDVTNWLSSNSIYKTSFGEALNRKETDLRDKFIKIRIRYSGKELAVIDFLNTIYTISYA